MRNKTESLQQLHSQRIDRSVALHASLHIPHRTLDRALLTKL